MSPRSSRVSSPIVVTFMFVIALVLVLTAGCGANGLADFLASLGLSQPDDNVTPDDGSGQQTPDDQLEPLVAPDLTFGTDEDTPYAATLATDPAANLTFNLVARPLHGALVVLPDGGLSYTPEPDFFGQDAFTYEITDGAQFASGTAFISVSPVNDPPTAAADAATITEDSTPNTIVGNVLANDTDPDPADSKTVVQLNSLPANVGAAIPGLYGTLRLDANGAFTYTLDDANPAVDALNTGGLLTDTFAYTLQDSASATSTATLAITILGINDTPRPADDSNLALEDGPPIGGNVLANDSDPETPALAVSAVNGDPLAVGNLTAGAFGSVQMQANGSYVYTLNHALNAVQSLAAGRTVTDFFACTITDGVNTAPAQLTITVTGANDAPVAQGDGTYRVATGQTLQLPAGTLLANDSDPDAGDTLSTFVDAMPTKAAAFTLNPDGSFSYTHDGSGPGTDSFTYHLLDPAGGISNSATVQIEIQTGVAANPDTYSTLRGVTLDISVFQGLTLNDTGAAPVTVTHYGPVGGPLTTSPGDPFSTAAHGIVTLFTDGSFVYIPDPAFSGQDAFAYEIANAVSTATATVTINVQRPPAARDDHPGQLYTTRVGIPLIRPAGDLFLDHGDGPDDLGFPAAALVLVTPTVGDLLTTNFDGGFSFSSNTPGVRTFTYRLQNPAGFSTATVTVTVTQPAVARPDPQGGFPADTTPTGGARPHPYQSAFNTTLTVAAAPDGLLANDILGYPAGAVSAFGPSTGQETTVASAQSAATANGGAVQVFADGRFTYSPPAGFTGFDTFKYALANPTAPATTATVTVAVGIRPDVADDSLAVTSSGIDTATGTPFSILTNDIGDALSASLLDVTHGTATIRSNGTFTFTPTPGYTGPATITYSASNGFGAAQGFVHLTVTSP